MSIRTVSLFTYRTHGHNWTPAQIAVLRFVRALKGENVGDRRDVCVNGVGRSLGDENADEAFEWFGEMATRVLEEELQTTRVVLVPVPDSASALDVARSRTCALAEAVSEMTDAVTLDVLRWNERKPRAHEGGPRLAVDLLPRLRMTRALQGLDRPFVLVDDLTTAGGHIQACASFLMSHGTNVVLAVCAAQADSVPRADPFQRRVVVWGDVGGGV